MKTSKIIIAILAIALIVWAAMNASESTNTAHNADSNGGKQAITIGLTLPLTGPVAILGEPAKKSAELALKDAQAAALTNGGKGLKYDYTLVIEDDAFDATKAASAANKLINVDKALAIISFGSGTGNSINAIAEKNKTVQFALASDPTVANGEYNYIHWTPASVEGKLIADEMIRRGYKKVSLVTANHAGTKAVTDSIKAALAGKDIEIVTDDMTNNGEKDFRTIIQKIKRAHADIVVLELFSPEIEIAAKQMKEQGVQIPMTSVEAIEWSNDIGLFEGQWFVSDSIVPNFLAKYKSAYGIDAQAGSSYVYDLVSMLIYMQEKQTAPIKPADLPGIITANGDWNSPIFGKLTIDKEGFFNTAATVKVVKGGKAVLEK